MRARRSGGGGEDVYTLQARSVTIIAASMSTLTILTCYAIAVYLGHVPAWLPMISDCALNPPEMYLFRLGMISSAIFLQLNSLLMFFYLNSQDFGKRQTSDTFGIVIVSIACLGLGIVGAVNSEENNTLHSVSALVYFIGYEIYMFIVTFRLAPYSGGPRITPISITIKKILCAIVAVALIIFIILSAGGWGNNKTYIAMCEWLGVMCIIMFNLSYLYEYKTDLDLAALLFPQQSNHSHNGSPIQYIALQPNYDGTF